MNPATSKLGSVCLLLLLAGCGLAATSTLPPGVTLKPIDGGADYFAKWSNSFPTDPAFFPIAVWAETLAAPYTADKYKAVGINTFANLWAGPTTDQMTQVKAQGMYAIGMASDATVGSAFSATWGRNYAGNMFGDELDTLPATPSDFPAWLGSLVQNGNITGHTFLLPSSMQAMTNAMHAKDPTRPVYNQFTKPMALPGWGDWYLSNADRQAYAMASDILSFDYYPITEGYDPGQVWSIYDAVQTARGYAGQSRPVWPFIETSRIYDKASHSPTPAEIIAEVWNGIIGGARGIEYFNHNFYAPVIAGDPCAQGVTQHLLADPPYAVVASAVKAVNQRLAALAPVINAPFANGYVTTSQGTNLSCMAKYAGGSFYIFAIPHAAGARTATFTLAGAPNGTVTVLDESRSLPVTNGTFSDSFASETVVHIYRLDAPSAAPIIVTQPQNRTVDAGQTATFSVVASGAPTLIYQWQRNGVAIAGATAASYTTPACVLGDNGASFRVVVGNGSSSVTSNSAGLSVSATTSAAPAGSGGGGNGCGVGGAGLLIGLGLMLGLRSRRR